MFSDKPERHLVSAELNLMREEAITAFLCWRRLADGEAFEAAEQRFREKAASYRESKDGRFAAEVCIRRRNAVLFLKRLAGES